MRRSYYDDHFEREVYSYKSCGWCLMGIVVFLLLSLLFSGCATKVVTVPEIHTEYIVKTDSFVLRDSIHVNDSIYVHEKGDTVWVEKFKTYYKDRWREVVKVDTVIKNDSIPYKVEVEKSLTWWQRTKIEFGEIMFLLLAIVFIVIFIRTKKIRW